MSKMTGSYSQQVVSWEYTQTLPLRHGDVRLPTWLAWDLNRQSRQKLYCLLWPTLRSHTLLIPSQVIGYKYVTSPHRLKESEYKPQMLKGVWQGQIVKELVELEMLLWSFFFFRKYNLWQYSIFFWYVLVFLNSTVS